jgi:hypothetical protein
MPRTPSRLSASKGRISITASSTRHLDLNLPGNLDHILRLKIESGFGAAVDVPASSLNAHELALTQPQ